MAEHPTEAVDRPASPREAPLCEVLAREPEAADLTRAEAAHRYLQTPQALVPGNRVTLLHDGVEAYPRMLAAIAAARESVKLETYIFADDTIGRMFGEALVEAARRGVEVTVLYDAFGSWSSRRHFFQSLRREGVKLAAFSPLRPWQWRLLSRRDHRKLLVIDGRRAFVGGVNIADCWAPRGECGGWRDDVLELEGPAAAGLDGLFRATWRSQCHEQLGHFHDRRPRGDVGIGVVAARRAIHQAYLHAINRARESVLISACYFVPDHKILQALRRARRRGVEVSLVLAGKSDMRAVMFAGRAFYDRLLRWGVSIYEWSDVVLHSKTAVVDGVWATVGSFNLDRWSLFNNHELNLVFADRRAAKRLVDSFRADCGRCLPITRDGWRRRPFHAKALEKLCYLFRRWL